MKSEQYSVLALRTAKDFGSLNMDIMHAAAGMAGESGEVIDLVKKVIYYGKSVDREKLIAEMGDIAWYMNLMISKLDTTWSEVFERNIAKLEARYPDMCFDADKAINRDEVAEQVAMNKVG
jgi:NTP pyrophosphatase (non-canonical NTP hydrolase)